MHRKKAKGRYPDWELVLRGLRDRSLLIPPPIHSSVIPLFLFTVSMDLFLHNYFLKTSGKFFKSISIPLGLFYSKNVFFFYITGFLKANGKAHRVSSLPQLVPEALPVSLAWSLPLHPHLHYPVSVIRIVPNPVPLGPRWPIHPQTHRHFEKDRGTASHVPRSTEAGILD